ncbi:PKD domain-containing protein [Nanoarchaeota archaeon]
MINKRGLLLAFVFTILISAVVSAEIRLRNADVSLNYGPSQILEGSFDLRLDEEYADSPLFIELEKDSIILNKSIPLIEFLKNSEANFTCNPIDCKPNYTEQSPSSDVAISQGDNYVGLFIPIGNDTQILSLSFNISGEGTTEQCGKPPVVIDLLEDGILDWQYDEAGDSFCELTPSPTYNEDISVANYDIGENPYCEKINVIRGNKFKLLVDMVNSSFVAPLLMYITDLDTGELSECNIIPGDRIRDCIVEFNVIEEKDHYICAQSSDEGNYKIKAEREAPNCGKFGGEEFDCDESTIDYGIYVQPAAFKVFDEEKIFDDASFNEFNIEDFLTYLQDYLDEKYGGDCDGGCIIPIKVTSEQENVELSNLKFEYLTSSGKIESNDFYELDREEAKLDMEYTNMQLSKAEFKVPAAYGSYDMKVFLGGEEIEDETIRVREVPVIESLTPSTVFAVVETEFSAYVSSPKNNTIMLYEWDFGDGEVIETDEPFVKHSYPSGDFVLSLTVTDEEGLTSTKTFDIKTLPPKEAVKTTLASKKTDFSLMLNVIKALPSWYSEVVEEAINAEKLASDLDSLDEEYSLAGADYAAIKSSLDNLPVYPQIEDEESGLALIAPEINVDYLSTFGELIEESKKEELKSSIESWLSENLDIRIQSTVKVGNADTSVEDNLDLLTIFEVRLDSKEFAKNNIYLIVEIPEGFSYEDLMFKDNITMQDLNGAFGDLLNRVESESIQFALPGRVDISEIKMFASPTLTGLVQPDVYCGNTQCEKSVGEDYKTCPEDCEKPKTVAIGLTILIILLLIGGLYFIWKYYTLMYEKKQIKELFTSEKDFFTLTFFVANELNKGKKEDMIKERLKNAEWKPEQIRFGLAKVKENTKRMQKKSLLNFVTGEIKEGKGILNIRLKLGKAGWNVDLINWAIKKAKKKAKDEKKP